MSRCRIKASGSPQGDYNTKESKSEKRVNTINIDECFQVSVNKSEIIEELYYYVRDTGSKSDTSCE